MRAVCNRIGAGIAGGAACAPPTSPRATCHAAMVRMYQQHAPAKVNDVDKNMAKYAGRLQALSYLLRKKYKCAPEDFMGGAGMGVRTAAEEMVPEMPE